MDSDATMKFQVNLDRGQVEAKLGQLRALAETSGLPAVAAQLTGVEGRSAAELEGRVIECLKLLDGNAEYGYLIDQLDMLTLSIKTLS